MGNTQHGNCDCWVTRLPSIGLSTFKMVQESNPPEEPGFLWIKSWEIVQTAQQTAEVSTAPQDVKKIVAEYIASELPALTSQGPNICSVPDKFSMSTEEKSGEKNEQLVFNQLKDLENYIPGLKMVYFNGVRYSGAKTVDNPLHLLSIKEMDFSLFCEYE